MPPPIGYEGSDNELVEEDAVGPLAGGHILLCLRLLDVKDPTKSSWKMTVSHHRLKDMLCHASTYWMWRTKKELVEDDGVTPLAGGHAVLCLRLLDVKGPTKNSWKTTLSHR